MYIINACFCLSSVFGFFFFSESASSARVALESRPLAVFVVVLILNCFSHCSEMSDSVLLLQHLGSDVCTNISNNTEILYT